MNKPLFLLGAGFNKDAKQEAGKITNLFYGNEINCDYPLSEDLYNICFPNENKSSCSIEELFDNSLKDNNHEPIRKLCKTIIEADAHIVPKLLDEKNHNCYFKFFNQFKEASFLTFNYDSLPELFLLKLDKWYPHDGYGIPVETEFNWYIENDKNKKKKHLQKNSSSFILHLHCSLCLYPSTFDLIPTNKENYQEIKLKEEPAFIFAPDSIANLFSPYASVYTKPECLPFEKRVIAPIPDKTEGLKNIFVNQMYSQARDLLNNTKLLVIIGYNFSVHDKSSYHNLLNNWEGEILLISPNANELENRLTKEYPKIKWRSLSTSFKNWVNNKFESERL